MGVGGGRRPLLCFHLKSHSYRLLHWVKMCNNETPKYHSRTPCHLSCWVNFLTVHSLVKVRLSKSFCEAEMDVI